MVDTIGFPYYPASNRTYGVFADVDGSLANTALAQERTLLLGQMRAAGSALPNVPTLIESLPQAGRLFGAGSMLYQMIEQYLQADSFGELWAAGIADPAGAAASGTVGFPGTASGAGVVSLSIGGRYYPIAAMTGDDAIALANRAAGLVNADAGAAVTATAAAGVLTLTARHPGLLGNDIDIRVNYLGVLGGQAPVPGMQPVAITPMSGGAGVPSLTAALAACADTTYDFVGHPYTDTASLIALDAFFNFATGRWSWQSMLYGGYFTAARGTPGQLAALGQSRNGPNGSILGVFDTPDPVWVVAADYCARCAVSLRNDPNVPLQNIVMGWRAPPKASGFIRSLRNTLLYDGISTYTVNRAGQVVLERAITLYQLNPAGIADNSYLDVETLFGTARLIRDWQAEMIRLYPRFKLLEDGNAIPAGAQATTAQLIRLSTIAWYRAECARGNAQDPDLFARAVVAQNAGNGLVKELLPFLLPNQLRQIAGKVQFQKP